MRNMKWKRLDIGLIDSVRLGMHRVCKPLMCKRYQDGINSRDRLCLFMDDQISEELKIVRWIVFMRVAECALKKILPPEEW